MYVPALLHSLLSGHQRLMVWTTTYADCTILHKFVTRVVILSTNVFEVVAIRAGHRFCQPLHCALGTVIRLGLLIPKSMCTIFITALRVTSKFVGSLGESAMAKKRQELLMLLCHYIDTCANSF